MSYKPLYPAWADQISELLHEHNIERSDREIDSAVMAAYIAEADALGHAFDMDELLYNPTKDQIVWHLTYHHEIGVLNFLEIDAEEEPVVLVDRLKEVVIA